MEFACGEMSTVQLALPGVQPGLVVSPARYLLIGGAATVIPTPTKSTMASRSVESATLVRRVFSRFFIFFIIVFIIYILSIPLFVVVLCFWLVFCG